MAGRRWIPPEGERLVGLGFYASHSPPVAGRIKTDASDFEVQEISRFPPPEPEGEFTVLRLRSRDWEQHELADRVAAALGRPPHSIAWAGTKDRRALSDRLFSYRGPPPTQPLDLPNVELIEAYRARDGLSLGRHFGNRFAIRIRELEVAAEDAAAAFRRTLGELGERGAVPNLFGLQRFGEVRPVTHLVGRALALGRPDEAVEIYLGLGPDDPTAPGDRARQAYRSHHDPVRALREFPPSYRFERTLLDHLARGHTSARALQALGRDLRTLFIHAYQAWLFNRWLTARDSAGISAVEPEPADRLLRVGPDGTLASTEPAEVGLDNLAECRAAVARGRARLAGPLVGFATPQLEGVSGRLLEELLASDGVDRTSFRLPQTPEIASSGSWRAVGFPPPPVGLESPGTSPSEGSTRREVSVSFALPKGSYATVLLRELLKGGATLASNQSF